MNYRHQILEVLLEAQPMTVYEMRPHIKGNPEAADIKKDIATLAAYRMVRTDSKPKCPTCDRRNPSYMLTNKGKQKAKHTR